MLFKLNIINFNIIKKILVYFIYVFLISWICLVGWLAVDKFKQKYPITRLKLSGQLDYIAPIEIQSKIEDLLNGNLWTISVSKVKDQLYEHPWVQQVFIKKLWPDVLKVDIIQHSPVAKWNDKFFLTFTGKILPSTNYYGSKKDLKLPEFYGQSGQENLVVETYLILLEKLAPLGLFISKIEIMSDQGIQITLNNNITLKLGTFDLLDRINRFIVVYKKKLQPIISDISYIDLRYTNGVAVGWAQKGGKLTNVQKR
jgi:cell division protein FtsQ